MKLIKIELDIDAIVGDNRDFDGLHNQQGLGVKCICVDCNWAYGYNHAKKEIRNRLKQLQDENKI